MFITSSLCAGRHGTANDLSIALKISGAVEICVVRTEIRYIFHMEIATHFQCRYNEKGSINILYFICTQSDDSRYVIGFFVSVLQGDC